MTKNTRYHVSGIFNGSSGIFQTNPKGWIGKTVCIELDTPDIANLSTIYFDKVKSEISFMNVGQVDQVKIEGLCDCSESGNIPENIG